MQQKEKTCIMCHLSAECQNCCLKCKNTCNSKQTCGIKNNFNDTEERWLTWVKVIEDSPSLLKFINKPIQNQLF